MLAGEYQMVEDRKVDRFTDTGQFPRCAAVGATGPGISPGMVVRQNNAGATELGGIDDDVAERQFDRIQRALVAFDMEAAGSGVDVSYP